MWWTLWIDGCADGFCASKQGVCAVGLLQQMLARMVYL